MHFSKRIITIAAAAAMSFCIAGKKECTATAADAPANIHLTVETKEIAIEDISDNRVVTLNVYQENCPPFDHMTIMFKKDPRLGFYPEFECFRNAEGVRNARKPDITGCVLSFLLLITILLWSLTMQSLRYRLSFPNNYLRGTFSELTSLGSLTEVSSR